MNMNYEQRRQKLLEDKSGPCMVLIFSGRAPMRSADESYSFSVDRNFYYLTGIELRKHDSCDDKRHGWQLC